MDITGEELYPLDKYDQWVCFPLNLEKELFHLDGNYHKIREIQKQYDRKVKVTSYQREGCATIEIRSPEVTIAGLVKTHGLVTYNQYIEVSTRKKDKKKTKMKKGQKL